jgi:hypothetical protein
MSEKNVSSSNGISLPSYHCITLSNIFTGVVGPYPDPQGSETARSGSGTRGYGFGFGSETRFEL